MPWLGDVPEHWDIRRIKAVFREKDERSGDGSGVLLSLTRARGIVAQSDASSKIASAEDLSKYKVSAPGDMVMNRMQAWSGMFAVSPVEGLVSPDYAVFERIDPSEVGYFEHLFKTPMVVAEFARRSKGIGSGFNRLYTPDFGAVSVVFPPLPEQAAIARFLDHTDRNFRRYVSAKQKLIALLEEQRQAIIHRAVTRGVDAGVHLRPSGAEWLGDVPLSWDVWQVGHLARVGNGSTPSRGNSSYWLGGAYPWLNSSSVNRGHIFDSDQFVTDVALRECHLPRVQPGSVLIAITGQGKTRGTAAILETEATINQHIAYVTPRPDIVRTAYLHLAFIGAYRELRRISEDAGSTKGALTCADISHFKIAIPPLEEQSRIVMRVADATKALEASRSRVRRQVDFLREYRTRLIADVVTGKIDVRDPAARLPDLTEESPRDDDVLADVEETESDDLGTVGDQDEP